MKCRRKLIVAAAVGCVAAVVLAGCGSSDPGGSSPEDTAGSNSKQPTESSEPTASEGASSSADSAAAGDQSSQPAPADEQPASGQPASGEPIVVADITDATGISGVPFYQFPEGAQAAVKYLNENGGVAGRPLKLITCDSKVDPAATAACANSVVQSEALAVTGIANLLATSGAATLQGADIALLSIPTSMPGWQDPDTLAFYSASTYWPGMVYYAATFADAKSIAYLGGDTPPAHMFAGLMEQEAQRLGVDFHATYAPPNAADLTPVVVSAVASHPDAIITSFDGPPAVQVIQALATQGYESGDIYLQSGASDPDTLAALGDLAKGLNFAYITNDPRATDDPQVKVFKEAMGAAGSSDDDAASMAFLGFANMMNLAGALNKLGAGNISAASLESHLKSIDSLDLWGGGTYHGTPPDAEFAGIHNDSVKILTWDGTSLTSAQGWFEIGG